MRQMRLGRGVTPIDRSIENSALSSSLFRADEMQAVDLGKKVGALNQVEKGELKERSKVDQYHQRTRRM